MHNEEAAAVQPFPGHFAETAHTSRLKYAPRIITVAPALINDHSTVTIERQRPAAIGSLPAPAEPAHEKLYSGTIRNRIGTAPQPQDAASLLHDVTT